jgi:hypothetical protein
MISFYFIPEIAAFHKSAAAELSADVEKYDSAFLL